MTARSKRTETAVSLFREGYSCSQAVLAAFARDTGLERHVALRVASGFGGGMGRMAQTCGAVSGAVMVLGLQYGPVSAQDCAGKERTYAQVREFVRRFQARHGTVVCRELLGCDISTPEGFQRAREDQLIRTRCPRFVRNAVAILEELGAGQPAERRRVRQRPG